ncbi:MAG TPA: hypothetical protein VEA60_11595 [Allosphingosinicella sp.]|nr:hypothetical protein [Allosphingosinicella sp.]
MPQSNTRLIVGAVVASLFLALYGYVLIEAILYAQGVPNMAKPSDDAFYVMNIVGGLVSAVVVAELAVTAAGDSPAGRIFAPAAADSAATGPRRLALVYVFAWLALGVAALLFGLMEYKNEVKELTEFAKTWLGLAIAAAYAYFGLRPANPAG